MKYNARITLGQAIIAKKLGANIVDPKKPAQTHLERIADLLRRRYRIQCDPRPNSRSR